MNGVSSHSDLQTLQPKVIGLLKQTNSIVSQAQATLGIDRQNQKYVAIQQEIKQLIDQVENLELVMSIIAPMKTGKSTIINAIVGQELLPSRNAAMTTLPTEIKFNSQLLKPCLKLSPENISVFQTTYQRLREKIGSLTAAQLETKIAQHPHLISLAKFIQKTSSLPLKPSISGKEAITKILTVLNDLVRLASMVDPIIDPLQQLTSSPRIETPFWYDSLAATQPKQLGNLVIVDTPGPNEAGENLRLTGVVENQLKKSSIVLLVLDFTQLNSLAAEAVKHQIEPVISLIGQDNLYVLINKVDQRRKGDMTPEQVKEFVEADLKLENEENTDRVFEISAIRAFSAAKFLLELQQHPGIPISEMTTAIPLAQEVFGIDWEEELEDATVELLQKKAYRLWKKSGFAPFLEGAVKGLMSSAAPKTMQIALHSAKHRLDQLKDDLSFRHSAIGQDAAKLQQETEALEADLKRLDRCRDRLAEVEQIKSVLQQHLVEILEELKQEAKVSIEDYFIEEDYQQADLVKKADIKMRELFLTNISDFELFPKWISKSIKTSVTYKSSGVVSFSTEQEASEFAEKAVSWAKQRAATLLEVVQKNIGTEIDHARAGLQEFLTAETQPIVERAKTRLEQTFQVNINLPLPQISSTDLNLDKTLVKSHTKLVDQGYGERLVEKRAWYRWLWLTPFYETVQYKKPYKTENYYTVSLSELVEQINQTIVASVEQINQIIDQYLEQDFQARINQFFAELDAYLSNYRNSLKQVQADQATSLNHQQQLVSSFETIMLDIERNFESIKTYQQQLDHY